MKDIFLLSLIAFVLSGCCVPWPRAVTPSVKGTVVDKNTQEPVAGAQVSIYELSGYPREKYKKRDTTTTDDSGKFSIKEQIGLGFIVFMGDPLPPSSELEVKKNGYMDYSARVWGYEVEGLNIELEQEGKE